MSLTPTPQLAVALDRIETYPKAAIAAINGLSQGGGNEMALACDFRIASNTRHDQPEILAGVLPGWGDAATPTGVGRAHTRHDAYRARSAPEALVMGMVNEVHLVLTLHL